MNEILDLIIGYIEGVPTEIRILITGLAIMLETSVLIGLVVPGDTVVLFSSTGITSWLQALLTLAVVVLGAWIGSSLGFWIGNFFGPKLRSGWVGKKIGDERWTRADQFVRSRGGIAVFVSRFLPVLHSLVPLTAGMSVMRYRTFVSWIFPASFLWGVLYISIGFGAADTYRNLKDTLDQAGWIFIGIISASLGMIFFIKKALAKLTKSEPKNKRRHSSQSSGPSKENITSE
jgi:membrane protein DedA with SNARE-associated domain